MFDYNSGCFFLTNFGDFLLTRNGYNRLTLTLYNEYLFYYLKAQTKYFHKIATGTTIKYISRDKFEELPFALPPFEEQKRIVSKIENLFTVLDEVVLNLV